MENLNVNAIENVVRDRRSLAEMFALKFNEWLPKDRAFHTGFALQVLTVSKKLLKLTEKGSPSIPKTKDAPELDKPNIFRILNEDIELKKYIPDNSKPGYISLEFYHSLLYHRKRDIFNYLYGVFESKKRHASESLKKTLSLQIPSDVSQQLFSYKSNFDVPKSKPFFQLKRYKGLFDENNQNINQNQNNLHNQNQNNNHMIIENNLERRNDNVNVNNNDDRINNANLFRDIAANNEFINLIRRIFDYMFDNNIDNVCMVCQNPGDRLNLEKNIVLKILTTDNYDRFRALNIYDQVSLINRAIHEIVDENH